MIQTPLEVYRIDMKYIRNLHNIDDRVLSVSPQIGKDERPFLGVIFIMGRDPVELAKRAKYKPPAMRVRGVCYTKKSPFRYNKVVQANL